jgi:hypothetical protein
MEQGAKSKTRDQKTDDNIPIANAQCNRLSQISFLIADRLIENPPWPVECCGCSTIQLGLILSKEAVPFCLLGHMPPKEAADAEHWQAWGQAMWRDAGFSPHWLHTMSVMSESVKICIHLSAALRLCVR